MNWKKLFWIFFYWYCKCNLVSVKTLCNNYNGENLISWKHYLHYKTLIWPIIYQHSIWTKYWTFAISIMEYQSFIFCLVPLSHYYYVIVACFFRNTKCEFFLEYFFTNNVHTVSPLLYLYHSVNIVNFVLSPSIGLLTVILFFLHLSFQSWPSSVLFLSRHSTGSGDILEAGPQGDHSLCSSVASEERSTHNRYLYRNLWVRDRFVANSLIYLME